MCGPFFCRKSLFWAQISIFDTKILRFSFSRRNPSERAWVQGSVEPNTSTNGPLQRPAGQFECFSLFSVIFCFFEHVIFIDCFLQILRVLPLRTPHSKEMVCIGTVYTALRRVHVATCSLNKKCFKKHETTVPETTNKTHIGLYAVVVVCWWMCLALRNPKLTLFWEISTRKAESQYFSIKNWDLCSKCGCAGLKTGFRFSSFFWEKSKWIFFGTKVPERV